MKVAYVLNFHEPIWPYHEKTIIGCGQRIHARSNEHDLINFLDISERGVCRDFNTLNLYRQE